MKQSENNTPASPPVPESLLFDQINAEVPDARPMRRDTPAMRASQRMNKAQSVWGAKQGSVQEDAGSDHTR